MRFLHFESFGRLAAAAITTTLAAGVWTYHWSGGGVSDLREFQNTEGIEAEVLAVDAARDFYRVRCRMTNRSPRTADHVVLTARAWNRVGQTIACNPLANVSDLPPQASKEMTILLPLHVKDRASDAEVEVTLVCWAE